MIFNMKLVVLALTASLVHSSLRRRTALQTRSGSCNAIDPDFCVPQAKCSDLPDGVYTCLCTDGWVGNGFQSCVDLDECAEDAPCPENSVCVNHLPTEMKFSCVCKDNFVATKTNDHGAEECLQGATHTPSLTPSKSSSPSVIPTTTPSQARSLEGICPSTEDPSFIFFQDLDFEDGRWEGWSPSGRVDQGSEVLSFFLGKHNLNPEDGNTLFPSKQDHGCSSFHK
jgi:hypothetical protein